jgi:hypothetical protein
VVSVGNKNLPEEIILSVEPLSDGNFVVEYDYNGESRTETTFNPFDRDDVGKLLKRRPELEKKSSGFSIDQLEKAANEVFQTHGESVKLSYEAYDVEDQWVLSNDTKKWVAVDADKAACIKKALKRSGYLQEVAAKLS